MTPKRLWRISCGQRSLEVLLDVYQLALRFAAGTTYAREKIVKRVRAITTVSKQSVVNTSVSHCVSKSVSANQALKPSYGLQVSVLSQARSVSAELCLRYRHVTHLPPPSRSSLENPLLFLNHPPPSSKLFVQWLDSRTRPLPAHFWDGQGQQRVCVGYHWCQLSWYASHRSQTSLLYRDTSEQATNRRDKDLYPPLFQVTGFTALIHTRHLLGWRHTTSTLPTCPS